MTKRSKNIFALRRCGAVKEKNLNLFFVLCEHSLWPRAHNVAEYAEKNGRRCFMNASILE
jgi:hypothetical protein